LQKRQTNPELFVALLPGLFSGEAVAFCVEAIAEAVV